MKTLFVLLGAATALAAAAPAAAQYGYYRPSQYGLDTSFDARIGELKARLDAGVRAGTITRRESWQLRRELTALDRLEQRYSYGGFTRDERDDLQRRIMMLRRDLRIADNGAYDRYERYGYGDAYIGRDNGYYGRGGPVDDWIGLRVGERVTSDLGLLPFDYQSRFRDGAGVYYRQDGHMIYEIDARTNLVLRTYPMDR